jgi:hypothetical protein
MPVAQKTIKNPKPSYNNEEEEHNRQNNDYYNYNNEC